MASSASVSPELRTRTLRGRWQALTAHPLRAAVLVAAGWALTALVLTGLTLAVQVGQHGWQDLTAPALLIPALALTTTSYLLRLVRWHLLAQRVAPGLPVGSSVVVGAIGFGLIMTPGRAGELLKLGLLRERTGVPLATSTPVFLIEKLCEATALGGLALAASPFLPWTNLGDQGRLAVVGLGLAAISLAIVYRRQVVKLMPRLPLVRRLLARPGPARLWAELVQGGDRLLAWRVLLTALPISVLARVCDGVALVLIGGLFGIELSLAGGLFMIGSSGFVGGLSLSPGGAGVAEAALVGLYLGFGGGPTAALAAALTARVLIFWIWVSLGLGLAVRYAAHPPAETSLEGHG